MPTEQGQGKPRPNSDIYALGIIGIQALTKMSPMQLQTRRPQYRAYLALGACQPWIGDGADNDGALPLQRPPVSKETLQALQQVHWYIPRSILKHSRIPLLNRPTPYTAATNSDIWTEQRLNFSVNSVTPVSSTNGQASGASSPINGRW